MSDVSVPPTHPDDEVVTRKILREELSKMNERFDTLGRSFGTMEEHLMSRMAALFEPSHDHGPRITQLEARTRILSERTEALEARRTVRRPRKRKRTTRKSTK